MLKQKEELIKETIDDIKFIDSYGGRFAIMKWQSRLNEVQTKLKQEESING